ncbi:hypothetical protein MTHERMOG20_10090 [Moorella thermoacetica]|uniref:Uncharacterized protein n=3 Tax=Neomoorella thermoacetica TaxID=1525 RepID=A0AAC9HHA3_NEOTH|nr:hypothetical protein [Moorella thermoacetica]AKX97247.1 hypothetical protein MOTHA_c19050 [Moorella thermoacetica]AOQ23824.1 hypothetical protein Maut_01376 [Moorella thermoacetica]OIQ57334.1 hypothetical protein MOCA_09200 [Moorella thermoacetica]QDA01077.1 hypothetical protein MothHH_01944 [Moorella thermoacetica]TYL10234.1 hypothetical protein MOOCA_08370 [Moorella thermoacetica]
MAKKNSLATVPKNNQKLPSSEVLEQRRQLIVAEAVDASPRVMRVVVDMALGGDLEAAKLVLKVAGLDLSGGSRANVQNAIQINITAEEQAQLERDFPDV